jgi:hypothetical protein
MCVRDSMKVYIRAEWLINVSSLSLVLLQVFKNVTQGRRNSSVLSEITFTTALSNRKKLVTVLFLSRN